MIEAIETLFTPICIYNNKSSGEDFEILKKFSEQSWNYPVVRFLDSKTEKDILERKDKVYTSEELSERMISVLGLSKKMYLFI
jgi:hypothetical protein